MVDGTSCQPPEQASQKYRPKATSKIQKWLFRTLSLRAICYVAIVTTARPSEEALFFFLIMTHPGNSAADTNQGHIFIAYASQQNVDYYILIGSDLFFKFSSSLHLSRLWFLSFILHQNTLLCILNGVLIYYL